MGPGLAGFVASLWFCAALAAIPDMPLVPVIVIVHPTCANVLFRDILPRSRNYPRKSRAGDHPSWGKKPLALFRIVYELYLA
jgi:hypothetical protein